MLAAYLALPPKGGNGTEEDRSESFLRVMLVSALSSFFLPFRLPLAREAGHGWLCSCLQKKESGRNNIWLGLG